MTITPRVGIGGVSFVHDMPGKEEKLVETCTLALCKRLILIGVDRAPMMPSDRPSDLTDDEVLTILRQEAGKNE